MCKILNWIHGRRGGNKYGTVRQQGRITKSPLQKESWFDGLQLHVPRSCTVCTRENQQIDISVYQCTNFRCIKIMTTKKIKHLRDIQVWFLLYQVLQFVNIIFFVFKTIYSFSSSTSSTSTPLSLATAALALFLNFRLTAVLSAVSHKATFPSSPPQANKNGSS